VIRFDDLPDVLTPGEVQSFLRLGRNATYDLLKNGTLRSVRLGQKYLIPREAVRELLDGSAKRGGTGTPMKGYA
jgi:excisionase family DNA binding protein